MCAHLVFNEYIVLGGGVGVGVKTGSFLERVIGFFPPLDNPAPDSRFRRWALQFRRRIRQKVLRLYLASSITSRFIVRQILYLTSFSDV